MRDIRPDSDDCCVRAEVFMRRGEMGYAVEYYLKALELDPKSVAAHLNLAIIYEDNDISKSIVHYNEVLKVESKNVEALYGLGRVYGMEGNIDESIKYFKECIRFDSFDSRPYCGLGVAYSIQKDYGKSIASFEKALELNPFDFKAMKLLGQVRDEMGDVE
ncbi:MAG: tetratricopeptide repeat protein [Candidatus Altiarchaeota archaeon]